MKAIASLLSLAACQLSYAGGDTNIVAISDWSKPVGARMTLRARMIISQEHSPARDGLQKETAFYLEFQNVTGAIGAPLQFYFEPGALRCELFDSDGKSLPAEVVSGSGGGAGPCWITLPYDSTIRLLANMYGYGLKPEDGFMLVMAPPNMQGWTIRAGDTKAYSMSGTISVTTPANHVPKDGDDARTVWSGTLELPKMKLSVPKK
ncbi:MAG: hypothetical protein H8M99_05965 [Gloeobacteraceae cyanobacterium ES-bin-144]|nr:hypothetical protein [Verrucomicrobiales bacterium]